MTVAKEPGRHQHFCIQPSGIKSSSASSTTGEATEQEPRSVARDDDRHDRSWRIRSCARAGRGDPVVAIGVVSSERMYEESSAANSAGLLVVRCSA
jgi:hypothetical protein